MEQEPQDKKENSPFLPKNKLSNEEINTVKKIRQSRFARNTYNLLFQVTAICASILTPSGREWLKQSNNRMLLFDRRYRVGMLEDSVLANNLHLPNEEETSLEQWSGVAGRYFAYDFNKAKQFGIKRQPRSLWREKMASGGRIMTIMPDEIKDNPPDQYTPNFYVNALSIDLFFLDAPPFEEIIKNGLLRETTYQKAYAKVGQLDRYRQYLALAGLLDEPIYSVTPKGNGIVFIVPDGGDSVRKPRESFVLKPVLASP